MIKLYKIKIDEKHFSYCIIDTEEYLCKVFNKKTTQKLSKDKIIKLDTLFTVYVNKNSLKKDNNFVFVENILDLDYKFEIPFFFIQSPLDFKKISIIKGSQEKKATYNEAQGLERSATWETSQIKTRIIDFYENRLNKISEFMKLKNPV